MKVLSIFFFFIFFSIVLAYQPYEPFFTDDLEIISFEKKTDGEFSKVGIIQDLPQFSRWIINNKLPVVLRLTAKECKQEDQMKQIFQNFAEATVNKYFCAVVNVDSNIEVALMFKRVFHYTKAQLPMVLFFKNGKMILPAIVGLVDKDRLMKGAAIRFAISEQLPEISVNGRGMPVNTVIKDRDNVSTVSPPSHKEISFWDRMKNFFFKFINADEE